VEKRAIIELVKVAATEHQQLADALAPAIHDALAMSLDWYAERRMFPFMKPLVELYGEYLTKKEAATWRSRIAAIEGALAAQSEESRGDSLLKVSVIGTIMTERQGEEPQKIRGSRQRSLLGLLVADRMLEAPLDHHEFRRLVSESGDEHESERARKTMNMAVYRLREAIGEEAVLTDEETPRLNTDRVHVDLLEAVELIRTAREACREGALLRAWPLLARALDIIQGEVIFPTLYDDFFEAVREDLEFELRAAIIEIARALLAEGDATAAETILQRGFKAMPEDKELSDLLCRALESTGKRVAAERVRMQATEA
jgi:two-component SAPR family response regulator